MRIRPESPVTARIESANTSVVHAATSVDHSRTPQRKASARRRPSACTTPARGSASPAVIVPHGLEGLNRHVLVGAFKRCVADLGGPRAEVRRWQGGHGDRQRIRTGRVSEGEPVRHFGEFDAGVPGAMQRHERVRAGEADSADAAQCVREDRDDGQDRKAAGALPLPRSVHGPGKRRLQPGQLTDLPVLRPVTVGVIVVPEVVGGLVRKSGGAPGVGGRPLHGEAEDILFEVELSAHPVDPGMPVQYPVKSHDEGVVRTGIRHGRTPGSSGWNGNQAIRRRT